jgi:DNA/RNA endonuclease YhcR with UshA esterase domain
MKMFRSALATAVLLGTTAPAVAHHSFAAQYDPDKPVTLTGVVTKVEWTNPHARFYIDVEGEDGTVTNWNLELASPNFLKRAGWSSNSLKQGDRVTVEGSMARSGANMANARTVTLPDGKRVFARSAADGG